MDQGHIGTHRPEREMPHAGIAERPRAQTYDVVIVGGATAGAAIAWSLAPNPNFDGSVLVMERKASLKSSATDLSARSHKRIAAGEPLVERAVI